MTANLFRGALGTALPRALFAPQSNSGPSGLTDPPRPFILRARHLDNRSLAPGERCHLDIHLFSPIAPQILEAFHQAAPYHGHLQFTEANPERKQVFPLIPGNSSRPELTLHFLTPTELKIDSGLAIQPDFPVLFARAATRLRTLSTFYSHPPQIDWPRLAQLSESVRLTSHSLVHEFAERHSTRTGQTHPLGGFLGRAHYQGELRELLPVLQAAAFTGVGRQTVWGKGEFVLKR